MEESRIDAPAVISYTQFAMAIMFRQLDCDLSLRRSVFGGIGQEVADHLQQPSRVALHQHVLRPGRPRTRVLFRS